MKTDVFGLTINYKSWDKKQALPLYVAGNYEIDEAIVSNNRFIVMSPIGDLPTLPAMKKHIEKIQKIEEISKREMLGFSDERIKEVRVMGGCTCVEVYDEATLEGFQQFAYERGVFCRPFLNYMYSMVPYVISDEELIQIFDVMKDWFH